VQEEVHGGERMHEVEPRPWNRGVLSVSKEAEEIEAARAAKNRPSRMP
jgi:hypothetical protein